MASRPKVYITRQIPQKGLDTLLEQCNVSFWDSSDPVPRGELQNNVRGVNVILCMPTDKIDREILTIAGESLKIVASMSDDAHHIDMQECSRRDIQVIKLRSISMETLTDITVALLAMASVKWMSGSNLNKLLQQKDVKSIKDDRSYCVELSNRTLGIYGFGALGHSVAMVMKDMGVTGILYHDQAPVVMATDVGAEYVTFDDLVEKSDIICVCSSVSSDTKIKPLFNRDVFRRMRNTAILIDVTKALVINFADLYEALKSEEIAAAGVDAREYDVIPNRHPLLGLDNCHFLPFRECYKWDGRRKLSGMLAQDILNALTKMGSVQNCK